MPNSKNAHNPNREKQKNQTKCLQPVFKTMKMSIDARIGKSPFEVHFGRKSIYMMHSEKQKRVTMVENLLLQQ